VRVLLLFLFLSWQVVVGVVGGVVVVVVVVVGGLCGVSTGFVK